MPEFYMIFARKLTKFPNFTWYIPQKIKIKNMTEFYMIFARKIFFRFFLGVPHAPRLLPICLFVLSLYGSRETFCDAYTLSIP